MNKILKCQCKLSEVMRSVIPVQGIDFINMIYVHLKSGENVRSHHHTEHTALYYPADCDPIVITPTAGMIIYLPPGTQHAVPAVKNERSSVALLVQEEKT